MLGAAPCILYNGTAEGGFTDDKKRSNQSIILQKCTARDRGGVVCAADGVPADCRLIFASWKYGKLPLVPMEKPFTT